MALLEQKRLKTRKKCRFRIYLRIYFGCFEVFWLEGKGFLGGNKIPYKCTETRLCYSAEKYCETI